MTTERISRGWWAFLSLALVCGVLLRTLFVHDMEYKEDEEINYAASQSRAWPWLGMPSGVYLPNPGMSLWVFTALARVSGATTPTEVATALQLFALLGIALVLPFALRFLRPGESREPWLWALALALVNPFAILYQRKLWPEPFLPFFSMIALAGWWKRDRRAGAFAWGLVGACLGQIHMSGFFLSAGFFLATLLFESSEVPRSRVRWRWWLAGSALGALPLIPWAAWVLEHPTGQSVGRGWAEAIQAKFWVFWTTDPIGLHLGNPLGLLRGQTTWAQLSDFVRYPLVGGQATWLSGLAHLVALAAGLAILARGLRRLKPSRLWPSGLGNTQLAILAAMGLCGLLMTASTVNIRRYYMAVVFPLEFVWLARLALDQARGDRSRGRALLGALWAAQLFMSACFVGYVHVNEGSTAGDYGDAYHVVMRKKGKLP